MLSRTNEDLISRRILMHFFSIQADAYVEWPKNQRNIFLVIIRHFLIKVVLWKRAFVTKNP